MAFLNIRFPTSISYGAVGGPGYSTDVVTLNSGRENRNQNWQEGRCMWDAAKGCKEDADREALIAFFRVAKGKANTFRWRDFTDYEVKTGQGVLASLGGGQFQLQKQYVTAAGTELRNITLPVNAVVKQGDTTLTLSTHYTLSLTTGILTVIGSPTPAPDSWTGEFDNRVRFDTDQLRLAIEDLEYFKSQNIPIIEVKDEED